MSGVCDEPLPDDMATLQTECITVGGTPALAVVLLHGYAMCGADLAPFAHSLGVQAAFYVPDAPLAADPAGRAWWPMDQERRRVALLTGPRDLAAEVPTGAPAARELLRQLVVRVRREQPGLPVVVIGFSQGGMLACDAVLHGSIDVAGLALLSSSRINVDAWAAHRERLKGLPMLVSHGETDDDLAFSTGVALRDFCRDAGAHVTWLSFPEGHVIPLVVWRAIRRFLTALW
jgi:phospholipase/carboxylesterase